MRGSHFLFFTFLLTFVAGDGLVPMHLNCISVAVPPYSLHEFDSNGNLTSVTGFTGALVDLLFAQIGYKVICNYSIPPDNVTGVLTNGVWDGAMKEMVEGRADIFIGGLSITPDRMSAIHQIPYSEVGNLVLVQRPVLIHDTWSFFSPFTARLWGTIIVALLVLGFCLKFIDRISYYGVVHFPGLSQYEKEEAQLRATLLKSYYLAFGQGDPGRTASTRFLVIVGWFFGLILMATYQANLLVYLTTRSSDPVVSSFADMRNKGVSFACVGLIYQLVAKTYPGMIPQMVAVANNIESLNMLNNGTVQAVFGPNSILGYYTNQLPCNLTFVDESHTIFDNLYSVGIARHLLDPTLVQQLDEALVVLKQNGTVDALWKEWENKLLGDCTQPPLSHVIGVLEVDGLFYLLAISIGAAFLMALVERLVGPSLASHATANKGIWFLHRFLGGDSKLGYNS